MYCKNCGAKVPDISKFCPYCGNKAGAATNSNQFSVITQNSRKKKKSWIIALICTAVVLGLAAGMILIKNSCPWFTVDSSGQLSFSDSGIGGVGLLMNGGTITIPKRFDQEVRSLDESCKKMFLKTKIEYEGTVAELMTYQSWAFNLENVYFMEVHIQCKDYAFSYSNVQDRDEHGELIQPMDVGIVDLYDSGRTNKEYISACVTLKNSCGDIMPFQRRSDFIQWLDDGVYHCRIYDTFSDQYHEYYISGDDLAKSFPGFTR